LLDKLASLPPFVQSVALHKATEAPFGGTFLAKPKTQGTYLCRRCGLGLWSSQHQFISHCGWPSFDERLDTNILELLDNDGIRTEILCARCHSHLGHVFRGEGFTERNQRDCVNSVMLDFVPKLSIKDTEEIIVAGGCFWGIQHLFTKQSGVLFTECGYTGGEVLEPTYELVCSGITGHYEAVRVIFDPKIVSSHQLYQAFFNMHNPSQADGQGPDIGLQYQSAIFYYNPRQHAEAEAVIETWQQQAHKVYTKLLPISTFWPAEAYHQHYHAKRCGL
jgi:peptide methionine sulfoxide reductase msrA/msrB